MKLQDTPCGAIWEQLVRAGPYRQMGGQPAFGRPHRQMGQPAARAAPFAKPGQPPAAADRVLPEDAPGHNTAADRVCQKVYRIITRR